MDSPAPSAGAHAGDVPVTVPCTPPAHAPVTCADADPRDDPTDDERVADDDTPSPTDSVATPPLCAGASTPPPSAAPAPPFMTALRPTCTVHGRPSAAAMASVGRNERKAQELMAAGEKESKRWFGGSTKFENAAEKYDKAGLAFKLAKNYEGAANAYEKAAEMHGKTESENDVANAFKEAGAMYEKAGSVEKAEAALAHAAELFMEMSRLSQAGKIFKQIAEMHEEAHNSEKALEFYERAADTFRADSNSSSAANQCLAKVAFFHGEEESFGKAAEVFDQVGNDYLRNNLLKFNARTHFTNALLCHLANDDMVMAQRKLNEYKESDYQFADSRECKLVEAVIAAFEGGNADAFVEAVAEYDRISKLNPWRVAILLKVKERLTAEEEEDLS